MSRKKVRKEVVKRKTNIYDPMGVYGRGLTANQRQGMTRQMKIENIRNPGKNITKDDLEEYRKILEFYGIYKPVRAGHIISVSIPWEFNNTGATFTNLNATTFLHDRMSITPQFYICNTFVIDRSDNTSWDPTFFYYILVGSSEFRVITDTVGQQITTGDSSVTIPKYFIDGTTMNYFKLYVDGDLTDMYIAQNKRDISVGYDDFTLLPNNSTPIPYLLYPNTNLPELKIRVGFANMQDYLYTLYVNLTVIY